MRDHASSILLLIINLQICATKYQWSKKLWCTRRESGGTAPHILDLATRRRLNGQMHATGGWVDPRARLDLLENTKFSSAYHESNPDRPARSLGSTLGR